MKRPRGVVLHESVRAVEIPETEREGRSCSERGCPDAPVVLLRWLERRAKGQTWKLARRVYCTAHGLEWHRLMVDP